MPRCTTPAGFHLRRAHRHEHRLRHQRPSTASAYVHRGTNWINAAPFFFNQDPTFPQHKVPQLHRYTLGGARRRPDHQGQALRLRRLSASARLGPGDRRLRSSTFPVGLSDRSRCRRIGRHRPTTPSAPRLTGGQHRSDRPRPVQLALASRRARQVAHPQRRPERCGAHRRPHRQRVHPRHRPLHRGHGRGRPGLQRQRERHARAQVLLPARSHPRALLLLQRARLHRAPRLRRAGRLHHQHLSRQVEPEHHADPRLPSREELGRQRAALRPRFHSRRLSRHGVHQRVRVELLSRRLHLQRTRRLPARRHLSRLS